MKTNHRKHLLIIVAFAVLLGAAVVPSARADWGGRRDARFDRDHRDFRGFEHRDAFFGRRPHFVYGPGCLLSYLPVGASTLVVGGTTYYVAGGTYYTPTVINGVVMYQTVCF